MSAQLDLLDALTAMIGAEFVFAMAMGWRIVTAESYRRSMLARWLSGRFCDPTTAIHPPA